MLSLSVLGIIFLLFLIMGIPITFSLGLSSAAGLLIMDRPLSTIAISIFQGIESWVLLAIPSFIFSGILMERCGVSYRLIDFSRSMVGWIRGGLGMTTVVGEIMFSGVSGSTVADVSAIGSMMAPPMLKAGYKPEHIVSIIAASTCFGVLIPPAIFMIVVGTQTATSVVGIFLGAILPGLVAGVLLMATIYIQAIRFKWPVDAKPNFRVLSHTKNRGGKMKGRTIFVLALAAGLVLSALPGGLFAAPKTLDLGDPIGGPPGEAPLRVALEYFSAEVPKRTNGEIIINYHPQTIVTSETKAVEMCKVGALAMAGTGGGIGTIFPNTQPLALPYLLRDYSHYYGVVRGPIGKKMEAEIEKKHNLKIISWLEFGFRQFANSKRPLNTLDDFKGLKLRVMPSPPLADMVNALGASAVPISWSEAIPAVQQGVVDGLDLPVANLISMKIYEICKYAAMSNHYFGPTAVVANLNIWKTLTKQQQDVILQLGIEAGDKNRAMMEKMDADGKRLLEQKGMQVTTPNLEPFKEVAKAKVYPKYYGTFGKDVIQSIMDFK